MSCTQFRIDTANLNDPSSQLKQIAETTLDTARTKLQFAWSEAKTLSATHNRTCRFVEYDYVAASLGTEHAIDDTSGGSANNLEAISMVRLDSGQLICAYGTFGVNAKESADNGVTWSGARVAVDGASGLSTRALASLGSDGTNVWCISYESGGGAGYRNVYATKRTGVDTWDTAGRKTIDVSGGAGPIPYFLVDASAQTGPRMLLIKPGTSGLTQCFIGDYEGGTPGSATYHVAALWTIDGWATSNRVLVKTFTDIFDRQPKIRLGSDGRIRAIWVDDLSGAGTIAQLAYSDDFGQTWSYIGSPSPMAVGQGWGVGNNRGFALLDTNNWIISNLDGDAASGSRPHRVFSGADSASGWTEVDCTLAFNAWGNGGEANVCGSKFIRAFGGFEGAGPYKSVEILIEDVPTTPGGPPPLVEESPVGTDQPNMYLRLDIADKRGWSGHQLEVNYHVAWPEGDYTTERRKPEILGASSTIDATIQDPAELIAYYKMDDQERWGKEIYMVNADASVTVLDDPFVMRWHSSQMNVGETGSNNIFRAVYLRYRRQGLATFDVQVFVDGQYADTQTIPAAWPDPEEFWWPIPRSINVGSRIQLRIEDRDLSDFIVEAYGIKFRPKHWRMRG